MARDEFAHVPSLVDTMFRLADGIRAMSQEFAAHMGMSVEELRATLPENREAINREFHQWRHKR